MSIPDVKLKKISLLNFRGAKELLDLDLGSDCKNCAIFGYNAEGKSTITQALEWFFTNKIAFLSGEGITDEDIINLASSESDETSVDIVFNKPSLNSSKIFDKNKGRHTFSNNSIEFKDYIDNKAKYDRLYLNQHTILWFLAQPKGEKKEQIAKIVGYEEIIKVKSSISGALRELEHDSRLADLQGRVANNSGIMTRQIYGEAVNDIFGLLLKSSNLLKVFGIEKELKTLDEFDIALKEAIQRLPSQERAKERVILEDLKTKISVLEKKVDLLFAITKWITDFNALIQDKESVSKLNLDGLLRQAEIVLKSDLSRKTCPLCEQPIEDPEALLSHLIERYRKLIDTRKKLSALSYDLSKLQNSIQQNGREWDEALRLLKEKRITHATDKFQAYLRGLNESISIVNEHFKTLTNVSIDVVALEVALQEVSVAIKEIYPNLNSKLSGLSITEDEKKRQIAFSKLTRGKELVLDNIKYNKEISASKLLIANMRQIETQLLDLQNSTMRKILEALSTDVNNYFCLLNEKDRIKNVKLEVVGEEGIEFSLEFYGVEASPPRKFLSESQLNSLGIVFFLAAVKKFNKTNKFFILDDVLVSFDKNYRLRLLELIEKEFGDYQILLLTHEEYWYHMIKRKFPNWVFKEVAWSFENGIRFKDTKQDLLEDIVEQHKKGQKVGNELRTYVEGLLKEICIALEVKLPFRLGLENERRTIGELFPFLTNTLKDHQCDVVDSKQYKDLEVSNFIMTASSHHNPDLDSLGDTDETIKKIFEFRSIFVCKKHKLVSRNNVVPGKNQISCKCGCQNLNWKE